MVEKGATSRGHIQAKDVEEINTELKYTHSTSRVFYTTISNQGYMRFSNQ